MKTEYESDNVIIHIGRKWTIYLPLPACIFGNTMNIRKSIRRHLSYLKPIRTRTLEDFETSQSSAHGGVIVRENCLLTPGAKSIHHRNGQPIIESFIRRGYLGNYRFAYGNPEAIVEFPEEPMDRIETAIILPCIYFNHFGLLLTEKAGWLSELMDPESKIWEDAGNDCTIVLVGKDCKQEERFIEGMSRLFDMTDDRIKTSRDIVNVTECRKVLIPQPTFLLSLNADIDIRHFRTVRELVDRWYGVAYETILERRRMREEASGGGNGKIYLSRSRLTNDLRKIIHEEELESLLRRSGWRIVHPETLPVVEQLSALNDARVIAGNLGSAMHLLMYFGLEARSKAVIAIGTESIETVGNSWVYDFVTQFRKQGILFWHLACLDFDEQGLEEKKLKIPRYMNLRPTFPVRKIVRKIEHIAREVLNGEA